MACIVALTLAILPFLAAAADPNGCDCYETSANDYFTSYDFYDFRNLSVPPTGAPSVPSSLPSAEDFTAQSTDPVGTAQSGYVSSSAFTNTWTPQFWGKPSTADFPVKMLNSLSNIYVAPHPNASDSAASPQSMLVLRVTRFPTYVLSAEMEHSQKNLFYASVRIRARVTGAAGAVAGMFFFRNDRNESDIEILTRDPHNKIRYSNQPTVDGDGNEIPNASTQVDMTTDAGIDAGDLPNDKLRRDDRSKDRVVFTDWHTHRLDWTADRTSWYIDGRHMLDKTYNVPTVSSYLDINMWSDGGVWSGNMSVGAEALLQLEWVELVFNTTGPVTDNDDGYTKRKRDASIEKRKASKCSKVCVIDETSNKGVVQGGFTPSNSTGSGAARSGGTRPLEGVFVAVAVAVLLVSRLAL